ncbi:hypothetical protein HYV49_00540 [Candidatus Pacearchaeota archaeon]|nr:hypothetical protein [Candidatus Pacearchaeota archaeon]
MKITKKGGFLKKGYWKVLRILILLSIFSFSSSLVYAQNSVDAIVVFESGGDIHYSIYGHNPAIPQPINQTLTWNWWSLGVGSDAPIASTSDIEWRPDIAFSREDYAMAVWGTIEEFDKIWCDPTPAMPSSGDEYNDTIYRGNITYSIFNASGWSPYKVVDPGAPDVINHHPSIAIDSSGKAIVVYYHEFIFRKNSPFPPFIGTPSHEQELFTDITFTAIQTPDGSSTRQKALAVWYDLAGQATCNPPPPSLPSQVDLFWAFKSEWDGNTFSPYSEVPGRPSFTVLGSEFKKLGVSTDQFGRVKVVFPVARTMDPCVSGTEEVWHAMLSN